MLAAFVALPLAAFPTMARADVMEIGANGTNGFALMAMQTGIGLTRSEMIEYAAQVIDIVVQLDRVAGKRGIVAISASKDLL